MLSIRLCENSRQTSVIEMEFLMMYYNSKTSLEFECETDQPSDSWITNLLGAVTVNVRLSELSGEMKVTAVMEQDSFSALFHFLLEILYWLI